MSDRRKAQVAHVSRRAFLRNGALLGFGMAGARFLAGCTPAVTPTPTPEEALAIGETPTDSGGGQITVTYMSAGTYDKAAEDLVSAFRDKWGTEVTVAAFPWMTLVRNNTNDLITGAGNYDVMSGSQASLWDQLEPLDPYIERDGYEQPFVAGLLDKMPQVEGTLRGLPYGADCYGLAARVDLFEEAGIEIPQTKWTWDEFDDVLAQLDDAFAGEGISAFVLAGGAVDQLGPFFWGRYDGYHFDKEGNMKHEEAQTVEALNRLKKHLEYGPDNILGLSIDEANAVFLAGNACILECWPSFLRSALHDPAQSALGDNWAFIPYPTPGFDYLSVWPLVISRFSKNKEAAWQWIKQYINQENDKMFFETYGIGPTMTTTYEDPDLLAEHSNDFPATMANLALAKQPVVPDEAEWFLDQVVSEVVNDIVTPEEGVAKVNEKWVTMVPARPEYELAIRQGLVEE